MIFRIGIEINNDGIRTIAWALEHPGCFAYGADEDGALQNLSAAVVAYADWISVHEPAWVDPHDGEFIVEDSWTDYSINADFELLEEGGYFVEPFFQYEWKPLTGAEIDRAMKLLAWSREELATMLARLTPQQWSYQKEGERWDIAGIVKHIGGAEWWYLDRLGLAFPREEVPAEPLEQLKRVRELLNDVLPGLEKVQQVTGVDGEFWSPRKVLRRALWHERDHTTHIRKLMVA